MHFIAVADYFSSPIDLRIFCFATKIHNQPARGEEDRGSHEVAHLLRLLGHIRGSSDSAGVQPQAPVHEAVPSPDRRQWPRMVFVFDVCSVVRL